MPAKIAAHRKAGVAVIGIDIGKNRFHLVGLDRHGHIVLRLKLTRVALATRIANLPPCLVGMEASVGAHLPVLRALHRSRQSLLPHAEGGRESLEDAERRKWGEPCRISA